MHNYIAEYYEAIRSHKVVVGKWIKLIYRYLIKGLKKERFFYDEVKAEEAVDFIENFCHHHEGRDDLLKLELWQKAIVASIFGIVDKAGIRIFREVLLVVARKNGKTLFTAAILVYASYLDGEKGAKIYCLAPKLDQAKIVFEDYSDMVQSEPSLSARIKKRQSDLYIKSLKTSVRPLAFSAKKSDGFNPQITTCDEIASWEGDRGLKQYEVIKSALGARKQPLIISMSTAGYINDSIYDELMKRATSFLLGSSKDKRLLPFLYIIDDIDKWDNLKELRKSNPNLGVSVFEDFYHDEIEIARNSLSKKAEFLTKYCNIKQNSSYAWLPYQSVDRVSKTKAALEDFRGCYCVGGIDLSQTTDLTACSVVIEREGTLYAFCQFFMPAAKIDALQEKDGIPYGLYVKRGIIIPSGENYVDYHDAFNWFKRLVEEYEILPLQVGYDRYSAQYLVQDMEHYGFHMDDVYQGENLSPVIKEAEGLIEDRKLQLVSNDLLKAHFLNVALKANAENRKVRPIKIEDRAHIDGFVSVMDALTVRQKWHDQIGQQLKNEEEATQE